MDVKIGDKVIIYGRYGHDTIGTVTKVTPAGSFAVDCYGTSLFDKTGRLKGAGTWDTTRADLATEEDIQRVKREKVIREVCLMLNRLKTTDLTYDQAIAVWKILNKKRTEEGE